MNSRIIGFFNGAKIALIGAGPLGWLAIVYCGHEGGWYAFCDAFFFVAALGGIIGVLFPDEANSPLPAWPSKKEGAGPRDKATQAEARKLGFCSASEYGRCLNRVRALCDQFEKASTQLGRGAWLRQLLRELVCADWFHPFMLQLHFAGEPKTYYITAPEHVRFVDYKLLFIKYCPEFYDMIDTENLVRLFLDDAGIPDEFGIPAHLDIRDGDHITGMSCNYIPGQAIKAIRPPMTPAERAEMEWMTAQTGQPL